jgi:acetate kinase
LTAKTPKSKTRAHAGLPGGKFILTVNGGSSSIKFALFETGSLQRIFSGRIEGIGLPKGSFTLKGPNKTDNFSQPIAVRDYAAAVKVLMSRIGERIPHDQLAAVGHRVVHGGPKYWEPQLITPKMIAELHQMSPFDPEHLPGEILLTKTIQRLFPKLPQFACFDTAFHHDLPRVAQLLPIPRRYNRKGVRRYGFHGLSCEFLIHELARRTGAKAAKGRVILAHLGNGASITAAHNRKSMDTSMSFTPTAGLVMSTRTGDLDPSVAWYLSQVENVSARQFHDMVNHESGLLGVSEISSDTRELLAREKKDVRAAEAMALFCYQIKKYICAMAGALEGLDTLVFAGGIGENAVEIRERICAGLGFLGVKLDPRKNKSRADIISAKGGRVTVHVIKTDEEWIIAKTVRRLLTSK